MQDMTSTTTRRLCGLAGLIGALLFFCGDMFFYGYLGDGGDFATGMLATVRQASDERLFIGGLIGPVAACLCLVGFWHVYLNIRSDASAIGKVMLVAFFILMVAGSAVHTLWTARGLAMKYCSRVDSDCATLLAAIKSYWSIAYYMSAAPGFLGALLLGALVAFGKTEYPRFTVIANPAVLFLLSPLARQIPAPIGAILVGGSANLSIAVFFMVSVIVTWNREPH
jgi:hypothetical protein